MRKKDTRTKQPASENPVTDLYYMFLFFSIKYLHEILKLWNGEDLPLK